MPPAQTDAGSPPVDGAARAATTGDARAGTAADAAAMWAGQVSPVARDALGMIGAAAGAQAAPQLFVVTVNMALIRNHPARRQIGPLLAAIPQWADFLQGTGVDPLRDADWVSINGSSLVDSERDVILVRYSAPEAVIDHAFDVVAQRTGDGQPSDAGVPKRRTVVGRADGADRVFMRPQPHLLAVVPPDYASAAAALLAHVAIPRTPKRADEALRLTLWRPHGSMPAIPESVTLLRLWFVPQSADGGVDIRGEGDTASPEACREAVEALRAAVRKQNSFATKLITRGLFDGIELSAAGPMLRLHVPVSREQLEVLLAFMAGRMGVAVVPQGGRTGVPGR
jgi:hypothetical protein